MAARPLARVLDTLSGRWSVLVISAVAAGRCRFNDLHRHLEGINHKVLIETLHRLQHDGYLNGPLTSSKRPERGGFVPYRLTELGRSLHELINTVDEWSEAHAEYLIRTRAEFISRHAAESPVPAGAHPADVSASG
ncbi:winged helix-turn-helix transcriptional regulator [Streptomyces zagrosensis]|uniref:DNA-binding HxlR family transcriptional regulator n=1 Tax=Streptomyces zagrosensis TaxID=1042984 RepID=A0A7W9QHA0_9ACTN|nr:helix-turn-helix domain-containing protein [Streptomyces zagrosensis]MBB5939007.1 DNA-binding HxlR family transcriptional regulator [Streptomyces zagrosensis]